MAEANKKAPKNILRFSIASNARKVVRTAHMSKLVEVAKIRAGDPAMRYADSFPICFEINAIRNKNSMPERIAFTMK